MLLVAALLLFAVGLVHSILGERYLIGPILRMRGLPVILRSAVATRRTIRCAWHATTLAWWGIAVVLACIHLDPAVTAEAMLWTVFAVFALSGTVGFVASRGRHPSWWFFLPVAAIAGCAGAAI